MISGTPDAEPVTHLRDALHNFHQAEAKRAEEETRVESGHGAALQDGEGNLSAVKSQIAQSLRSAESAFTQAQHRLERLELERLLTESSPDIEASETTGDPLARLDHSVETVTGLADEIRRSVEGASLCREAQRNGHNALLGLCALGVGTYVLAAFGAILTGVRFYYLLRPGTAKMAGGWYLVLSLGLILFAGGLYVIGQQTALSRKCRHKAVAVQTEERGGTGPPVSGLGASELMIEGYYRPVVSTLRRVNWQQVKLESVELLQRGTATVKRAGIRIGECAVQQWQRGKTMYDKRRHRTQKSDQLQHKEKE